MEKLHEANGHVVTVAEARAVSNGALAVFLRCCDNPETDHVHTMYELHAKTEAEIDAALREIAVQVARQHASLNRAREYVRAKIGT